MDDKEKTTYVDKVGKVIGGVIITCVAACAASVIIALTIKFISWLLF